VTGIDTNADQLVGWWRQMLTIRFFEEKVQELYLQGLVPGTTHLCQGQEAVSVGAVAALEPEDYLTITYRGHGQALARGMDIERAFAEIMGRQTGVCRGFGGSMHLTDMSRGLLGAFAIVGAGLPVAVGAAMSAVLQDQSRVAMTFFGDGAVNIGTFHEALNMASVWKAPVVFICENNLYGEFSPVRHTTPIDDLSQRASAYAIPG
jgi:acetoin:2,6-dichlorophenolindophenol oxidoreductase subunit alpha